jgi:hypothetical protein
MRAAVSFVLFGAGAVIGVTSFLLALLWWKPLTLCERSALPDLRRS